MKHLSKNMKTRHNCSTNLLFFFNKFFINYYLFHHLDLYGFILIIWMDFFAPSLRRFWGFEVQVAHLLPSAGFDIVVVVAAGFNVIGGSEHSSVVWTDFHRREEAAVYDVIIFCLVRDDGFNCRRGVVTDRRRIRLPSWSRRFRYYH